MKAKIIGMLIMTLLITTALCSATVEIDENIINPIDNNKCNFDEEKWEQLPDTTPFGIDIRIDQSDSINRMVADDFKCTYPGYITKITLWGSWHNDTQPHPQLNSIYLAIYSDLPPNYYNYSMPNKKLWEKTIYYTEFTESIYHVSDDLGEYWWDPYTKYDPGINPQPDADKVIWQYDIPFSDPEEAFYQEGTYDNPITYWLVAYANINPEDRGMFGWKTSSDHWNDDTVKFNGWNVIPPWSELKFPHYNSEQHVDMSFRLQNGDFCHYDVTIFSGIQLGYITFKVTETDGYDDFNIPWTMDATGWAWGTGSTTQHFADTIPSITAGSTISVPTTTPVGVFGFLILEIKVSDCPLVSGPIIYFSGIIFAPAPLWP